MSPNPIADGDTITYTFTIHNYGNTPATDVVLTDRFDPEPSSSLLWQTDRSFRPPTTCIQTVC